MSNIDNMEVLKLARQFSHIFGASKSLKAEKERKNI